MSDRINWITVVLEKDIRDDDCENILTAIRMINGVLSAKPNVADPQDYMARSRVRSKIYDRILNTINEGL